MTRRRDDDSLSASNRMQRLRFPCLYGSARGAVAIAALLGCLAATTPARAQNDWQFPDPYFGVIEFDVSRPSIQRAKRIEVTGPSRPKVQRSRPLRGRPRWSGQTSRP